MAWRSAAVAEPGGIYMLTCHTAPRAAVGLDVRMRRRPSQESEGLGLGSKSDVVSEESGDSKVVATAASCGSDRMKHCVVWKKAFQLVVDGARLASGELRILQVDGHGQVSESTDEGGEVFQADLKASGSDVEGDNRCATPDGVSRGSPLAIPCLGEVERWRWLVENALVVTLTLLLSKPHFPGGDLACWLWLTGFRPSWGHCWL
eukprot:3480599-Rhodomonas_salina.2